jgi:hypothetical protein
MKMSNSKQPVEYGVPREPTIRAFIVSMRDSSTLRKMELVSSHGRDVLISASSSAKRTSFDVGGCFAEDWMSFLWWWA